MIIYCLVLFSKVFELWDNLFSLVTFDKLSHYSKTFENRTKDYIIIEWEVGNCLSIGVKFKTLAFAVSEI